MRGLHENAWNHRAWDLEKKESQWDAFGYFLHEPGSLIGLPWEQKDTGGRGEIKLVYNSTFTAELSVTVPVPGFDGKELRMAMEQMVAFTPKGTYFLDGRQKKFYLVK